VVVSVSRWIAGTLLERANKKGLQVFWKPLKTFWLRGVGL
jgi:hypothetical protein